MFWLLSCKRSDYAVRSIFFSIGKRENPFIEKKTYIGSIQKGLRVFGNYLKLYIFIRVVVPKDVTNISYEDGIERKENWFEGGIEIVTVLNISYQSINREHGFTRRI